MYKMKAPLRARIDPPLRNVQYRVPNTAKYNKISRQESTDRFSSFQTPPPSDGQFDQFSDYDNSPKASKEPVFNNSGNKKKGRSYILVEQMPVQASSHKKSQRKEREEVVQKESRDSKYDRYGQESRDFKENDGVRYKYLKTDKDLSTIRQDQRQNLRQSNYSSKLSQGLSSHPGPLLPLPVSVPVPTVPKFRYYEDILEAENAFNCRIEVEQTKLKYEEQRIKMGLMQQENISLRQTILHLEHELKRKQEQKMRKQAQLLAQRVSRASLQQENNCSKRQTKQKLLDEIALLQNRCKQMKQEMIAYKAKQEQRFSQLFRNRNMDQHQTSIVRKEDKDSSPKKQTKQRLLDEIANVQSKCKAMNQEMAAYKISQQQKIHQLLIQKQQQKKSYESRIKTAQYYEKFIEVFLNMMDKIPVQFEPSWSDKRKIAVGWRVVKYLIKKALKLGLQPPKIVDSQDLQ